MAGTDYKGRFWCDLCGKELFWDDGERKRTWDTVYYCCWDCSRKADAVLILPPGRWETIPEEEYDMTYEEKEKAASAGTPTTEVQENQLSCA